MASSYVEAGVPSSSEFLAHALYSIRRSELLSELPSQDGLSTLLEQYAPGYQRARNDAVTDEIQPENASLLCCDAIASRSWRKVAHVAAVCICSPLPDTASVSTADLGHTVAWWQVRLLALIKLQFFQQMRAEFNALWTVIESLQVYGEDDATLVSLAHTSHIPYSFHILHGQALFHSGYRREGVDAMWYALHQARYAASHADDSSYQIWVSRYIRTGMVLASLLVEADEIPAVHSVLRAIQAFVDEVHYQDPYLYLCASRLYMQMSDMKSARNSVKKAEISANLSDTTLAMTIRIHQALLSRFTEPHALQMFLSDESLTDTELASQSFVNTLALEHLYTGDVMHSIQPLETLLHRHPITFSTSRALGANLLALQAIGTKDVQEEKQNVVRQLVQWAAEDPTCVDPWPPSHPDTNSGMSIYFVSFVSSVLLFVAVLCAYIFPNVLVSYWQRERLWSLLSQSTQTRILTWLEYLHLRGGGVYSRLTVFDWHAARNAGLSSDMFDIEANILEGDSRVGLDEAGMQEVHQMMQQFGISFDEARLRRHRAMLQKYNIDPQTGMPLDAKAITRL